MNSLSKGFIYKGVTMKRSYKRAIMVVADLIALPLALWSSYALRLSEWWPQVYIEMAWWLFVLMPIVGVYVFMRLGLYRAVVRFMGAQAIWAVVKGVMLLALFLWAAATLFQISFFPRSVPISFALAALVYVGGSRLLIRHYYHWLIKHYIDKEAVLIYGAGGAGVQLATSLSDGREFYPLGFIDDDKSLWGSTIKGLPIYNPSEVKGLVRSENIKHILLAVANVSNCKRKEMLSKIEGLNARIQTIPSMPEILSGQASIEQLREVQIEELLGRDSVPPLQSLLTKCITNKVVMVTGAGGSVGSELCREIIKHTPKKIILLELSEYNLYKVEQELRGKISSINGNNTEIVTLLGAVQNRSKVQRIFQHFSIDTVYHAAAYKHVPIVEHNVIEGVSNNIFGTQVIADESAKAGVGHFILISTDKAVRPTNVMGATKRFAELILQNLAMQNNNTIFSIVRFGNVLGSSGSVVPLFRQQIQSGGPISVTHKEITRYFMTIPEAVSLVVQAGSMAKGGDVFVLDMGESVKITDLAKRMIRLSGLEVKDERNPDGDIEIHYTGLRPAEKLYEELLVGADVVGTEHSKIMRANEDFLSCSDIEYSLSKMKQACEKYDYELLRSVLEQSVTGYCPHESVVDYLSKPRESNNKVLKLR